VKLLLIPQVIAATTYDQKEVIMKTHLRIASLSLLTVLCFALSTTAFANTIYNDGATNGTYNALFIDGPSGPFGQSISDGFVASGSGTGTEVWFAEWVLAGDTPTGVSYALSSTENFGGTVAAGANFGTTVFCYSGHSNCDPYGYDVYTSHFNITGFSFTAGNTYYLTLTDATDSQSIGYNGWDINSGPAVCNFEHGQIIPGGGDGCGYGGESFTITGGTSTTPEPSSIMLLGSGTLGLSTYVRRRLLDD